MRVHTTVRMMTLFAAAILAACGASDMQAPPPDGQKPVAAVEVIAPSLTLIVGRQMTLVATPRSADGGPLQRAVTWSSQNEQVATVNGAGVVTAVAPGQVGIVARSEQRTGVAQLVVTAPPIVPVADIRLSVDDEVQLEWDGTAQLAATAYDAQGNVLPGRAVQWMSSKPAIATVDQAGVVKATGTGIGMIAAMIDGVSSTVGVRVKQAPVVGVVLDLPAGASGIESGETVFVGTSVKLASGQLIQAPMTWTTTDAAVATASSSAATAAAVVARAPGTVTLTGSAQGKSASLTLKITPKPTHDLIYSRWDAVNKSEIFTLSLDAIGAAPVKINAGNVSRDPSPSPDGAQLVFAVSQIDQLGRDQNDLYIVNRNGQNMRWLTRAAGVEFEPAWSPDGTKIVFRALDESEATGSIWVVNVDGTGLRSLSGAMPAGMTDPAHPAWSPDGTRIAFTAPRGGQRKVWIMNADGSNPVQLTTDVGFDVTPTWSPDGSQIAFARYNPGSPDDAWDVMIVSATGGTVTRLAHPGDQLMPAWSPDGQYLAVTGTAVAGQGTQNIYTMRPDGTGLRLRTVNAAWGGGTTAAWITR